MSREIKFRFRYTDGKNWIMQVFDLMNCCNGEPFEVISDNALLKNYKHVGEDQFIGKKDINGKDIYEGDILEYDHREVRHDNVVRFNSTGFWLQDKIHGHCFMPEKVEVIGNIFENENLVK